MYETLLKEIDEKRETRILPVSQNGTLELTKELKNHVNGLYWLYTSYSIEELKDCTPSTEKGASNIPSLTKQHSGLKYVIKYPKDGYLLVYNGVGGVGDKGYGGLRERIQQEFNGGKGTGSLSILKSSLKNLSKWHFSYVTFISDGITPDIKADYSIATQIERMWRLEYGWPLLCKH